MSRTVALTLALAVVLAAGVFAPRSSGAVHRKYTIALAVDAKDPRLPGARAAAKQLGVRVVLSNCLALKYACSESDATNLVAQHVDAFAGEGYDPSLKPFFNKARQAGIRVLASGDDIAAKRELWVSYSGPLAYAHALADALASQIHGNGEYVILEERHQFPSANTQEKIVQAYIPNAYPNMKLDAVLNLSGAGDQAELDAVKNFISTHPNLKGLIGITPTEAIMAAAAITQTSKIGQVFSAGNGGSWLKGTPMVAYLRSGATEDVMPGEPRKLGYLTIWAAHYLLTGHHFKAGEYRLAQWGMRVRYYPTHRELRLGQPLTLTQYNIGPYLGLASHS
jgi:rhamnose transport system substrate-binding protein